MSKKEKKNKFKEFEPCTEYDIGDIVKTPNGLIKIVDVYPPKDK